MNNSINLKAIAHRVMTDNGFAADFPSSAIEEVRLLQSAPPSHQTPAPEARDLRTVLWSSIDDTESLDLDQVEFIEALESGDLHLMVGIADVDRLVGRESAIDQHAAANATSVYTGVQTFPMLPTELSTGLTSLLGNEDRTAIVIDLTIATTGEVTSSDVYSAVIHNYAKLSYSSVGQWLDRQGSVPTPISSVQGMEAQVQLQVEGMKRLHAIRAQSGALNLETIEARPVIQNGTVTGISVTEHNTARDIIENFMIAANTALVGYLQSKGSPVLLRVVRTPERWQRIVDLAASLGGALPSDPDSKALADFLAQRKAAAPEHFPDLSLAIVKLMGPGEYVISLPGEAHEGHFGLAVHNYTHSTAPNRRYADLVTQRLVKAAIEGESCPYTGDQLSEIAARCTERENAARKVERQMRKVAAAVLLGGRVGETFDAIVTGVSDKGTFARLISPPVDGRVMRGEAGMDVGDKVRVRLISTDPTRGFIDLARA